MIGVASALASLVRGSPPCTAWVLGPTDGIRWFRSRATSGLEQLDLLGVPFDGVIHLAQVGSNLDGPIGMRGTHPFDLPEMVGCLLIRKLEAVRRRNHH